MKAQRMVAVVAGYLVLASLMVMVLATAATAQDTPTSLAGAKTVTAEEVKSLLGQGAKVYDLRKKASYVEKHIPGAIYGKGVST
jgi:hypothetical protein